MDEFFNYCIFIFFLVFKTIVVFGQPAPCGPNPAMTSTCATACVICDIDGFSGVNNLTAQGQGFGNFCTTQFNNMQYIAFIAGTEDLTIRVDVGNCVGGIKSLEVGFFQSLDCQNFSPITICDTDIEENTSQVFESNVPLTVGQYYYLVIDGSASANCSWTFNVEEGSTEVLPLVDSGILSHQETSCPGNQVLFNTSGEFGASTYLWEIDGKEVNGNGLELIYDFPADGTYEVCVTASNVCDGAPPSCSTIEIRTPGTTVLDEVICNGECIAINNTDYCFSGSFSEVVTLDNGCDSLIFLELEVLPQPQTSLNVWICNDQAFEVGNSSYSESGNYLDTVLTENDCDSLVFLELLAIECEITGQTEGLPALCAGTPSGTLIFSIDQGTPPLTFTYTNIEDESITGTGMTNLLENNEIQNIPAGMYQIYIVDEFGNDVVLLQEVTEPQQLQASIIASDYNGFNVSCFNDLNQAGTDGELSVLTSFGTPPYTYIWSNNEIDSFIVNLQAQNFSVTITDANECEIVESFMLTSPPPIEAIVNFSDPNCDGEHTGFIGIDTVLGGVAAYSFSLNDTIFSGTNQFSNLIEGDYDLFVEDANGCIEIIEVSLTAADIPEVSFDGDTLICLGDSVLLEPNVFVDILQSITWDNSATLGCDNCPQTIARPFSNQEYNVLVVSSDGCVDSTSILVGVENKRRVYVPNIFTPNNDGLNDLFFPNGAIEVEAIIEFKVYDRWGELVYEVSDFPPNDSSFGWDGRFKERSVQSGIYAWTVRVVYLDGEEEDLYGTVTVDR